jgi:predicted DNA-binding transcriptional regulator AlpA
MTNASETFPSPDAEAGVPPQDEPETDALPDDEENSGKVRQDRMIVALLDHLTQEKAAAALGISTVTLWRQMQKPDFAIAFRKARRQAVSLSVARLQQATGAAVATLLRVMTDREAPASTRIRAADMVLQGAFRGMEIEDIEVRLADLEEAAETPKQNGRS